MFAITSIELRTRVQLLTYDVQEAAIDYLDEKSTGSGMTIYILYYIRPQLS